MYVALDAMKNVKWINCYAMLLPWSFCCNAATKAPKLRYAWKEHQMVRRIQMQAMKIDKT